MMKISTKTTSLILTSIILLHSLPFIRSSSDTINSAQIIRDGGDTLVVSSGKTFALGFFSPAGTSGNRYVGIWYNNIRNRTVIWVANRDSPLTNTKSGVLTLDPISGKLLILDESTNTTVWSTNNTSSNPVLAQLLDSGNLVIREVNNNNNNNLLWQSFDYLTDTIIPGTYFGWNLVTGREIYVSSWKADNDPGKGEFTMSIDLTGYPQTVIRRNGALQNRLGPFNGRYFSGVPLSKNLGPNPSTFIINSSVVCQTWFGMGSSDVIRYTLSPAGVGELLTWVEQSNDWVVYYTFPRDMCDAYEACGVHGVCNNENFPSCGCLERFVPRDKQSWAVSDWSGGCVRRSPLNCSNDVFMEYSGIKMPDAKFTRHNSSLNLEECKVECLRNCSCTAYTNLNVSDGGSGCQMWFGDLVDIRVIPGEDKAIYIRLAASELGSKDRKRKQVIAILTSLAGFLMLGMSLALFILRRAKKKKNQKLEQSKDEDYELPMFDFSTITKATNDFSVSNKLGEGGFGPVYKGILEDGNEIAVKKLSETSSQGLGEFKNEVICIAKLQHRNLVKLLGWCIEGEEKMLIYEYMPNKSLDSFLFGHEATSKHLDWPKRLHIINGIARGLSYLHQDSCLRVIHRDLKASNILLDNELNPKISDFGMAKIFRGNETQGNTRRVVGTYGYMAPEYVIDGFFSTKSDVYSFGVLALEIVSGHTNRGFHHDDHHHNLVGHAWILYKEGRTSELVDPNIVNAADQSSELLRSIHVALLCVQQRPEDRPNMCSVVVMLGSGCVLPEVNEPGFFKERQGFGYQSSNECTFTLIEAR